MMKKFLLLPSLLLTITSAQAIDFPEECTVVIDSYGNDYTECVPVISQTSTTYNMTGTMDLYVGGGLLYPGMDITGQLTTTVWHDDWFNFESGVSTTLQIGPTIAFDSYTMSTGTVTPYGGGSSYDIFGEEMLDTNGSPFLISSPTLWDIVLTPGMISMRTLDADGNGINGIETAISSVPPDSVLDIRLTAVPVPAAIWLFASGLLGLLGMSFKRK